MSDTTLNQGALAAGTSRTRFYLSVDATHHPSDQLLTGSRAVGSLAAGVASTGTVTVTIPGSTPLGTYRLLACADDLGNVSEADETNNCLPAAGGIQITRADLVVTALTNPPGAALPGTALSVMDTTQNQGLIAAGASTTRYYLSVDSLKDAGDRLLTGTRAVGALGPGAVSTGTVSITIPGNTVLGTYHLLACADDMTSVTESNESNNCLASATAIEVARPDLVTTAVGSPPLAAVPGEPFYVFDIVLNQAPVGSGASTTRYYLSADTQKNTGDRLLSPTRAVAALAPGASPSTPPFVLTVTIPANMPLGAYYLLACADDTTSVTESNESNNCLASTSTVLVTRPDLIEAGLSEPPATVARGGSFGVTETVVNQSPVTAGPSSTTRFYLSVDGVAKTKRLNGTRAVGVFGPGASSTASPATIVSVPNNTALGTYRLLACADDTTSVIEIDETNNCLASSGTIVVTP